MPSSDMTTNALSTDVIFLKPLFHNKIWGGRRLAEEYGYDIPEGPVGECWAISAHPNGDCEVASGAFSGKTLSELWASHRELFGNEEGDRFPLLIKILDAKDDLSVQVHPDDQYAAEHENGSLGKSECWYILDAKENGDIVVGQNASSKEEFAAMVEQGNWAELLNYVPIKPGDFFRIDPGTVHAIRTGTLILETQQSSDVTYRVYDYDRLGDDGKPRDLHLAQSLEVINYAQKAPTSGEITAPEIDGVTELMSCKYFSVERYEIEGSKTVAQPWPFMCVSVIGGEGTVSVDGDGGLEHRICKGSHFIAPASSGSLRFTGTMTLITSHLPHTK